MVYNTFNIDINPKIIIEVGTCSGSEAINLKKKYPECEIYTFEADPQKKERIEKNILNSGLDINFYNIALGKEPGSIPFYKFIGYDNDGADSLFPRYNGQMKKAYDVECDTLKNQMNKLNIQDVDLLCLDVQGSEYNILLGLGDKLKNIKNIILEIPDVKMDTTFFKIPKGKDSVYNGAATSQEIIKYLKDYGFEEVERRRENDLESNILFKNTNNIIKPKEIIQKTPIKKTFDCVLSAVNNNNDYLQYIPDFVKSWLFLFPNIDIKIILINNIIPDELLDYSKYIILFKPIEGQNTAYTAQNIRLYYPAILGKGGVLITDIDIFPMNIKYYTQKKVSDGLENNKFIIFRNAGATDKNQEAICYNMASSETWKKLNNCHNLEDIKKKLIESYPNNYGVYMPSPLHWLKYGWFKDQEELYKMIHESKIPFVRIGDSQLRRIDKLNLTIEKVEKIKNDIKNKKYSDFIPCRKDNAQYEEINNLVIKYLTT